MHIDKNQIIDLLRSQGQNDKAQAAERDLPGTVDTDKDRGLLEKLGLDPQDLLKMLGGGGLGNIGSKLGL